MAMHTIMQLNGAKNTAPANMQFLLFFFCCCFVVVVCLFVLTSEGCC